MAYEMTQEAYRKFSEDILSAGGDQATLTTLLSDMQDTFYKGIADLNATAESNSNITKENERLKQANMDLFLRLGTPQETQSQAEEPPKPISTKEYMENYLAKLDK